VSACRSITAATLLLLCACTAHVTSELKVDGAPFTPTTCVSGQSRGFPGIELGDAQGRRLRLATNLEGFTGVAYFTPASTVGEGLGTCARMNTWQGVGVINGVRNLEGDATLTCQTISRRVEGRVQFKNCH
jgi:hypothetical protein